MGTAYQLRYQRSNRDEDAEDAKRMILEAANSPDCDFQMMCFNQIGHHSLGRFIRSRKIKHLIQAIAASEKAACGLIQEPNIKASYLLTLGIVSLLWCELFQVDGVGR